LPPVGAAARLTPYEQLRSLSASLFPRLAAELKEQTGIDNGFIRSGGLEFATPQQVNEWRQREVRHELVASKDLRRYEPALAEALPDAFFLPDMAQVRNPRHLQALIAACESRGVRWRRHCAVYALQSNGSHIAAVDTAEGKRSARRFLLAAGAWSDDLLASVGLKPGIHPVRGQIALLNTSRVVLSRIVIDGKRYLVPRDDGHVLVGSTEEDVGFDKRTTACAISELLAFGLRLIPALASAAVERCWAGLRPASHDELPFIGQVPGFDNLFVAAGHFRSGLELSPATGLIAKEMLLGEPTRVPLQAFRLDR
jgi:glycine oxidase